MKNRQDCNCPCHHGGVAVHVVPCCDGMPSGLFKGTKKSTGKSKHSKKAVDAEAGSK